VACALQLDDGFVHPSINCEDLHPQILETIAPECVVRELRSTRTTTIAKASFGFGDVNACVVLHKPN
jgi:3-oxoacyl-(acyl-carrier-protein) synthase